MGVTAAGSEARLAAARAALRFVDRDAVMGVGTGATAAAFVDAMVESRRFPRAVVPSSAATSRRLREVGIRIAELPDDGRLPVYVDGTDEADGSLRLIKGGGGAHAREKVLASASDVFVCLAPEERLVARLGESHPVPVEVLPMASRYVARVLAEMGGVAVPRAGFVTDNHNEILDVTGLDLSDPVGVESAIDTIAGVLACGLFALRPANLLLLGSADGSAREVVRP